MTCVGDFKRGKIAVKFGSGIYRRSFWERGLEKVVHHW
jgi:hypothetical protein